MATDASKFTITVEIPIQVDGYVAAEYLKKLLTEALCNIGCPPYRVDTEFNRD